MSLTTSEMSPADIAAVTGGGSRGGSGFGDGNGWWIILLFLALAGAGGWGNNGSNGGGSNGGASGASFYPYYLSNNTDASINRGFDNLGLSNQLTGVQSAVQSLSSQFTNCCCDMRQEVANGFYQSEIADNARQIANMQTAFAAQTAMSQGFNGLQSSFADCCCENRLANCQTQNLIQNEANATRFADANNTRDIIQSQTNGTQAIIDKLCQLELDAKNDRISDLERQLTMANLAASQGAQTAQILADNARQTALLEANLNPVPVPAYVVQNPNCCPQNTCGCGGF